MTKEKFGQEYYAGETSNYRGYSWEEMQPYIRLQYGYLKKRGLLRRGAKLLEVGCAKGFLMRMCDRDGVLTHGIEVSSYAAKEAKKYTRGRVVCQSAEESYPFDDRYFDVVASFEVVEHLRRPERALAEMYRVLKPGGTLVISTPNSRSMRRLLGVFFRRFRDRDVTHVNVRPAWRWKKALRDAGFMSVETRAEHFMGCPTLRVKTGLNLEPLFPFFRDGIIIYARR